MSKIGYNEVSNLSGEPIQTEETKSEIDKLKDKLLKVSKAIAQYKMGIATWRSNPMCDSANYSASTKKKQAEMEAELNNCATNIKKLEEALKSLVEIKAGLEKQLGVLSVIALEEAKAESMKIDAEANLRMSDPEYLKQKLANDLELAKGEAKANQTKYIIGGAILIAIIFIVFALRK